MDYAEQFFRYEGFDCPACMNQAAKNKTKPPCRRDGMCFMEDRVNLAAANVLAWNFFWSMEANSYEFALAHYHPHHVSEFERDLFYEKLSFLRNKINHLRNEETKKKIKQ